MSAIGARRRRATGLTAIASAAAVIFVIVCGVIGANALYNSSDGTNAAAPDRPVRTFPELDNLLLGVVDSEGRLASIAVFTESPDGDGGSIVSVPVDAAVRMDGDQVPLSDRFEGDPRSLEVAVGGLLGLSFDEVKVIAQPGLAEMLAPVEEVTVELPAAVVDDRLDPAGGEATAVVAFDRGEQRLGPDEMAQVLAARSTTVPDEVADRAPVADENQIAVWKAIGEASSERSVPSPSAPTIATPAGSDGPASSSRTDAQDGDSVSRFVSTLLDGAIDVRGLASEVIEGATGDDALPLMRVQRADVLLVFAQISPQHVAAPATSFNVRLVAPYDDDDVPGALGVADVAARVIRGLVAADVNVVSVSTTSGDVPETTQIELIDLDIEDVVRQVAENVLGDHELETADYEVPGVDVIITLGEDDLAEPGAPEGADPTPTSTGN